MSDGFDVFYLLAPFCDHADQWWFHRVNHREPFHLDSRDSAVAPYMLHLSRLWRRFERDVTEGIPYVCTLTMKHHRVIVDDTFDMAALDVLLFVQLLQQFCRASLSMTMSGNSLRIAIATDVVLGSLHLLRFSIPPGE